jgi:hypothetical protein
MSVENSENDLLADVDAWANVNSTKVTLQGIITNIKRPPIPKITIEEIEAWAKAKDHTTLAKDVREIDNPEIDADIMKSIKTWADAYKQKYINS